MSSQPSKPQRRRSTIVKNEIKVVRKVDKQLHRDLKRDQRAVQSPVKTLKNMLQAKMRQQPRNTRRRRVDVVRLHAPTQFVQSNDYRPTVTHDRAVVLDANELLYEQYGSGPGVVTNYDNYFGPANSRLFPLFSHIARCFTKWQLVDAAVDYIELCYNAIGTSQSAGEILAVINYDPQEPPFGAHKDGFAEAFNYTPHMITVPFKSATLRVTPGRNLTAGHDFNKVFTIFPSYNQPTPAGVESSVMNYYLGRLQLMANNNAVTTEVGRWQIRARFRMTGLREPDDSLFALTSHLQCAPTSSNFFAGLSTVVGSSDKFGFVSPSNNFLSFTGLRIGARYVITFTVRATTSIATSLPVVLTSITPLAYQIDDTESEVESGAGTADKVVIITFTATANTGAIELTAAAVTGTALADIWFSQLPAALVGAVQPSVLQQQIHDVNDKLKQLSIRERRLESKLAAIETTGLVAGDTFDDYVTPSPVSASVPTVPPRRK